MMIRITRENRVISIIRIARVITEKTDILVGVVCVWGKIVRFVRCSRTKENIA